MEQPPSWTQGTGSRRKAGPGGRLFSNSFMPVVVIGQPIRLQSGESRFESWRTCLVCLYAHWKRNTAKAGRQAEVVA